MAYTKNRSEQKTNSMSGTTQIKGLVISVIEIAFEPKTFRAARVPYPGEESFRILGRDSNRQFVYRMRGAPAEKSMLVIPIITDDSREWGATEELAINEYLHPMAALIRQRLPFLLPKLNLVQAKWRLRRINRKNDLVKQSFQKAQLIQPRSLSGFHKFFRTEFDVRCIHQRGRLPFLGLTIQFSRQFEISVTAATMLAHGLDLNGIWLVNPELDEPLLGSVVERSSNDKLIVSGDNGLLEIDPKRAYLEPSLATFRTIMPQVLGQSDWERYDRAEWEACSQDMSGNGYLSRLKEIADYFIERRMQVLPDLSASFTRLMQPGEKYTDTVSTLQKIIYCFSPDRSDTDELPSRGLDRFGPFDSNTFDKKDVRFLILHPADIKHDVEVFYRRLIEGMARERQTRFVRGLRGIYQLGHTQVRFVGVDLPEFGTGDIGSRYIQAIQRNYQADREPDLAMIIVRDEHALLTIDNPYLATKAYFLRLGIPTQEVRSSTMQQKISSLPYTLESIAVAIYAKLGGCPWTVLPSMPVAKEIVFGIGHAEVGSRFRARRRYVGITTVFTSNGNYLLAAASPRCRYEDFPAQLTRTVAEVLTRLREEQNWRDGDIVRLIFHARRPLRNAYTADIAKAAIASLRPGIEFEPAYLTITRDHPFKAADARQRGQRGVGKCVPTRGTAINLGKHQRLLCVSGAVLARREGEPIPQPLLITLHQESKYTDLSSLTRQVFQFTGLSWRSVRPIGEPVTIAYSDMIADLLNRLEVVDGWDDSMLNKRLLRSRWFL